MKPKRQKKRWGTYLWSKISEAKPWMLEFDLSNAIWASIPERFSHELGWSQSNGDHNDYVEAAIKNDT